MAGTTRPQRTLNVLYHLHPAFDTLDLTGPLELFSHAKYSSTSTEALVDVFHNTLTAATPTVTSGQKLTVERDIALEEVYERLADFDVLVIPGGGAEPVLKGRTEPVALIRAFVALPRREDGRARFLLSICTGSLFLAAAGVLGGLVATTHYLYYDRLREITGKGTKVVEERFVVNPVDEERELRIVTSGGVSCGLDAALWVIGEVAGEEVREETARVVVYEGREGVVL